MQKFHQDVSTMMEYNAGIQTYLFKHVNFDTYVYVYRCLIQNMNEHDTICILHMFLQGQGRYLETKRAFARNVDFPQPTPSAQLCILLTTWVA